MKTPRSLVRNLPLIFLLAPFYAEAATVNLNFSGPADFQNNFRRTFSGTSASDTVQSGNLVTSTASTGKQDSDIYVYDTTPADASVQSTFSGPSTISLSARAAQTTSSFGIFIVNPASEGTASHVLALFNWDTTGTTDRMRIFTGNSITLATVGATAFDSSASAGVNAGTDFVNLTLTYRADTVDPTRAVLNFTAGSLASGDVLLASGSYLANYELGVRIYDGGIAAGSTDFTNLLVIPEPSSCGLLAFAGAGLLMRRVRAR